MPFGANTTAVLAIISAILIVTVVNNILSAQHYEVATKERQEQLEQSSYTQKEIQEFVVDHRNQTQALVDMLRLGVDRQDDLIAKLDQVINETNNNNNNTSR